MIRNDSDKLILKGMRFYGFHGNREDEKQLGQWFEINITVFLDLAPAAESDDLTQGISYSLLYKGVKAIVEGPPFNLIEALAYQIITFCFSLPLIQGVRVKVKKPQAPLKGPLKHAAVEMLRFKPQNPEMPDETGAL